MWSATSCLQWMMYTFTLSYFFIIVHLNDASVYHVIILLLKFCHFTSMIINYVYYVGGCDFNSLTLYLFSAVFVNVTAALNYWFYYCNLLWAVFILCCFHNCLKLIGVIVSKHIKSSYDKSRFVFLFCLRNVISSFDFDILLL